MEKTISLGSWWIKYFLAVVLVFGLVFVPAILVQACGGGYIAPNEVWVDLSRSGSGVDLQRVKAALGSDYFNSSNDGIIFRCVDGQSCDVLLTSKKIFFRSHNVDSQVVVGDIVLRHLSWLVRIEASIIDTTHIKRIAEVVRAEKMVGGYGLAYGHYGYPDSIADSCAYKAQGKDAVCGETCVQQTPFSPSCSADCSQNLMQTRFNCFLACPAIKQCYEINAKDDWKILSSSHDVDKDGNIVMYKCGGGGAGAMLWSVPEKVKDFSAEIDRSR